MRDRFTSAYTMNITKTAELAIDERLPPDRAIKARVRTRLKITATEGPCQVMHRANRIRESTLSSQPKHDS
jgi:hypothetical protein